MPKNTSVSSILSKTTETIEALENELAEMLTDFEIGDDNSKIVSIDNRIKALTAADAKSPEKDLDTLMENSFIDLNKSASEAEVLEKGNHTKSSEETQRLLKNLDNNQKTFAISMKMAQIARLQLVSNNCRAIEDAQNPEEVAKHAATLNKNLDRLDAMPSTATLTNQTSSLSKLVDTHALTSKVIPASIASDRTLHNMGGEITQAFKSSFKQFANFVSGSNNSAQPSADISGNISNISKAAEAEITNHFSNVNTKSDDIEKNRATLQNKLAEAEKDLTAKREAAKKELSEKLEAANQKLAGKEKPKPAWKRFFTALTLGKYSGGKPEDTTEDKKEIAQIKESLQNESSLAAPEQKKVAELAQQIENQKNITGHDEQKSEARELVEKFEQINKKDQTQYQENPDLKSLVTDAKGVAEELKVTEDLVKQRNEIKRVAAADQEQKSEFSNLFEHASNKAFFKAHLIKDGDVQGKSDLTDQAINAVDSAFSFASIPIVSSIVHVGAVAASYAYGTKKDAMNQNIADFGSSKNPEETAQNDQDMRNEILQKVGDNFHNCYADKSNGTSPLSKLSLDGRAKFAVSLVESTFQEIANLDPNLKIPQLDDDRVKTDPKYRQEITEKYGFDLEEFNSDETITKTNYRGNKEDGIVGVATQIDRAMYVDFMAQHLTNKVLEGKEPGVVSKQVSEFSSKIRFEEGDFKEPLKKGETFTIQGLTKRIAVQTSDGQQYVAQESKDAQKLGVGDNAKYGFRLATPEEEKRLKNGTSLPGYEKFTTPKEALVNFLVAKEFKDRPADAAAEVDKFLEGFSSAKEKDAKLELRDYLKSPESTLIENKGTANFGMKDANRRRLDDVAEKLEVVVKSENRQKEVAAAEKEAAARAQAQSTQPTTQSVIAKPLEIIERDPQELEKLKEVSKSHSGKRDTYASNQKSASSTKVVDTVVADLSNKLAVASNAAGKILPKTSAKNSQTEEFQQAEQDYQNNSASYESSKKELLSYLTASPDSLKNNDKEKNPAKPVNNFVENYHLKVMGGAKKSELEDFLTQESPVTSNNKRIEGMARNLAISYSETQISQAKSWQALDEEAKKEAAPKIAAATPEPVTQSISSSQNQNPSTKESVLAKFNDLSENRKPLFHAEVVAAGGQICSREGGGVDVIMPKEETSSTRLVLKEKAGKFIDAETLDANGKSAPLFETDGKVKPSQAQTLPKLLEHSEAKLNEVEKPATSQQVVKAPVVEGPHHAADHHAADSVRGA